MGSDGLIYPLKNILPAASSKYFIAVLCSLTNWKNLMVSNICLFLPAYVYLREPLTSVLLGSNLRFSLWVRNITCFGWSSRFYKYPSEALLWYTLHDIRLTRTIFSSLKNNFHGFIGLVERMLQSFWYRFQYLHKMHLKISFLILMWILFVFVNISYLRGFMSLYPWNYMHMTCSKWLSSQCLSSVCEYWLC